MQALVADASQPICAKQQILASYSTLARAGKISEAIKWIDWHVYVVELHHCGCSINDQDACSKLSIALDSVS